MKEIVETHEKICFISTSELCFNKCPNYFTNKDSTKNFRISSEKRKVNQEY